MYYLVVELINRRAEVGISREVDMVGNLKVLLSLSLNHFLPVILFDSFCDFSLFDFL